MKYENIKQVKSIADQIDKHQSALDDLLDYKNRPIQVRIEFRYSTTLYTIGTESGSEHQYAKQASELLDYIISDLERRIDNLKSMLEQL